MTKTKVCSSCQTRQNTSEFYADPRRPGNRGNKCRSCRNAAKRARPAAERRKYQLKFHYGLTPDDVATMAAAQDGKCYICKRTPPSGLCVDHNHVTGKVRKLLCQGCNLAIGHAHDDPIIAAAMAAYLQEM